MPAKAAEQVKQGGCLAGGGLIKGLNGGCTGRAVLVVCTGAGQAWDRPTHGAAGPAGWGNRADS
ncbi:hypothetical protein CHLRE_08g373358v5 [Chlamydomonas reinhardtii]|uniref:Uncharacterized protein n=1 Tax=Chlamydomonas reinhardtii TaxID=3055 RepID=A0A2K3DHG1_CHLRE|nr:uncharacterized protein CHLRE_08g373358v5 [Chlamydomonas reinhardtii]PNW79965.1 hypothetical protein CHLRE_08g373358v5 [Chlamydomonas reinhardtii]